MPRAKKRSRQKKSKSAKAMLHLPSSGPNSHFVVENGSQAKVGLEGCCMVFSPQESPVYGGDELVVTVDNLNLPTEAEFFILYTGSNERHVTRAQRINSLTFQANIPDHNLEEVVDLDFFYRYEEEEVRYQRVANGQFRYCYDSAHHLARQLLESKADEESFKLAVETEDLSTLDVRLRKALEYIASTEGWPSDHCKSEGKTAACDKLLDFAAYFGLPQVTSLVLTEVGTDAVHITNSKGQTPRDVALAQGHNFIADILTSNTRTLMKSESMKFERDGVVVHRNRNGAISIATTNVHEDTVRGDMELLKSIEIDMAKEEQLDTECDQEDVIHLGKRDNEDKDLEMAVEKKYEDSFQNASSINENEEKEKADSLKSTPEEEKTSANILSTEDDAVNNVNINDHSINTEATQSVSALDVNTDSTAAAGNEVAEKESTLHIEEDQDDALMEQLGSAIEASTPVVTTTDKIKASDEMSSANSHSESINYADTENENVELSAVIANQAGAVDHFLEEDLSSEASDEIIDFSTQETPVADVTTTSTTDAAAVSTETTSTCNTNNGSISPTESTIDSKVFDTGDGSSECTTSVAVNNTELVVSTSTDPSLVHETPATLESADVVDGIQDLELNAPIALTDVSTSNIFSPSLELTDATLMPSVSDTGDESSPVMPNSSTIDIESSTVISGSPVLEPESNVIISDSPDSELVTSTTIPDSSTSESVTSTTMPDSSTSESVTSTTNSDSFTSEGVTSTTMPESSPSESVNSSMMPDSVTTESLTSSVSDSAVVESVTSTPVPLVSSFETETTVLPESVSETDDVPHPPVTISDTADTQFDPTSASDVSTTVPHMSIISSEAITVSTSQIPVSDPQPSITNPEDIDSISEELSSVSVSKTPISEIYSPADSTTTDTADTDSNLVATEFTCSVCLSVHCKCEHSDILQVSCQTPTESTVPEEHAAPNTESILESESNATLTSMENSRENSEATISSQPLSPLSKNQTTSSPLSSPSPPPVPCAASAALTPPTPPVSAPPPEAVPGDCGSTNNTFSKAQHEAGSSDSSFQEYGTHRILKGEPLSNGHTISSLLNNNCDLGSLGVLDTLLEERETSEEPVEKSPMVLTESIEAVRSISRHIQKLRNHGLGPGQNVKPDNLQRHRSCPILDAQDRCASPSASEESVHHRSMLDLAPGVERQPVYSDTVFGQDLSGNLLNSGLYQAYDPACGVDGNDSGVRICINGVTVGNSSENLAVSTPPTTESNFSSAVSELVKSTAECVHGTEGRFVSAAGRDKEDYDPGTVSSGYGEHVASGLHKEIRCHPKSHSEVPKSHRNLNYIRSTMASSLSGKSHSLNSLTGAEESDEDSFHDARENPTPSQSMMNLSSMPSDVIHGHQRSISSGDAYSSYGKSAFTDNKRPPSWPLTAMFDYQKIMEDNGAAMPSPEAVESPDSVFESSYSFPTKSNVNFAKSSSTSCLPAATDGSKGVISQMKRQNKQYYTQKLEDNEKFRRQQEFEEIDEVAEINKEAAEPRKNRDKKDFGKNLHDMLISSSSKDEKDKDKYEEKKKKSSNVLAKFGSTRKKFKKGKDGKEKENKHKSAHQFVSLSISNTSLCHVCNKSMANKAAVQCENCLINVHESSCKEQIPFCSKLSKSKATLQEGSNHGLREKQYPSAPVQSTKFLDSSKRSSSAPNWQQEGSLSHTWPDQRISEEREEFSSNRPESMHSNIGETISESMESLDEHGLDQTVLESDPFLCMEENEPEAWSISVEKKVVKKLSSKEVKRQDHIYELVLTEKRYCRKLTIMQKIIYNCLLNEVGVSEDCLNVLFPRLEELLAIHMSFFNSLQHLQSQSKDKIVDEIGKVLIEQFDGESSEKIKSVYGYFCSHHKESAHVYKELIADRKVLSFIRRWSSNSLFEKREIPDFLLIVTHRLTKYPTMIESILKNTKDKKERDNLNLALEHIKDILTNVNSQVEEYERAQHLEEMIQRIDPRSHATYRGRKFKRGDLSANYRRLIHEGEIGWKVSRNKVTDVTVLVLTDLIVLMQENNQKYTFLMQDNKSCVIPLYELLVREKGDTKDCKGIYLISTKRQAAPEMYELVCKSTEDMKSWMNHLSYAVRQCPRDVPVEATQSFKKHEEQKMMEIRRQRIQQIFEKMKSLDQDIIRSCDDKKCLLVQYAELMSHDDGAPTIVSSTPNTSTLSLASTNQAEAMEKLPLKDDGIENDYLQYALKEITKLTKVLQESSACIMSPVGGGTEHLGSSISTHAVPKRAETFAGFDSDLRKDPAQKRPHSYVNQECRSASMFNLHESNSSGSKDSMKMNNRKSTGYIQSMVAKHHTLDNTDTSQTVNLAGMALVSCIDAPSVPSNSDTSTVLTPPPSALDQNTAQIYHFLHSFLQLSTQQNTTVEDLRTQLAEAKELICKMNTEKLEINKHSQLEGLRNLKEELMREREEFELEKKRNSENLEKDNLQLQKEKDDLKSQQEELRRAQIALQKQIDLFMEHRNDIEGRRQFDRTENPEQPGFDGLFYRSSIQHNRSASAELASQSSEDYMTNKDLKDSSKPAHKSSVGNLVNSSGNKTCAPHLFSATNEQRSGEKLQQFLPLKLADNSSSSLSNSKGASQSQHRTGLGRSVSSTSFSTGKDSSSLSQVMKLAEPSRSAHKERPPNHPPPIQPKSEPTDQDVIYF